MENFKTNQKGVTLIVLVVTIILMAMLAAVTIEVGTGSIDNSKVMSFLSYMQTIQSKVNLVAEYEDYSNYGEALSNGNKTELQIILNNKNESFSTTIDSSYLRFFDSTHIASDLGVDNINDEIIVDFNTREVISLNGVKYEGEMYYTQYHLPGGQTLAQQTEGVDRIVSFGDITSNITGLNATFTIADISLSNGTLSYGRMNESEVIKWTIITNYTKKGEDITTSNITESGVYYFKLTDNTSGKDNADSEGNYPSVEIKLTNAPKLEGNLTNLSTSYNYSNLNKSENWAFATDKTEPSDLVYYIWIPRFVYKLNSSGTLEELQFLRGTSDITTSGSYINNTEWTESTVFINGNSIQGKLPKEYQQVEYIEGTGTQYIELDYIASNITNSKGTYQITNMTSALMLFGSRTDSGANGYALNWGNSTNPATYFNTYYSGGTAGLTNTQLSAEKTTFEKRGVELYINDELIHTHSSVPTFTTPYKMIVFGCNSGGTISYFAKAKIFNLQFYDNDELKVDLIPCYRISDNVIGMYDLVNDVFYENIGTGTFLKGNNVQTPGISKKTGVWVQVDAPNQTRCRYN